MNATQHRPYVPCCPSVDISLSKEAAKEYVSILATNNFSTVLEKRQNAAPASGALEAPEKVQGMFSRIAARYDLANSLLSGGLDYFWRRRSARIVRGWQPARLLDLATGSGVFAQAIARACPGTTIVGGDFCYPMLVQAQKARRLRDLVVADAMALPFADGVFDAVTVAFGLRNMPSWSAALDEMRRVLRPDGHLLVLDFSLPQGWWGGAYRFYLANCLPPIAGIISGERGPYEYLVESIGRFPSGGEMVRLIEGRGFSEATAERLSGGIVSLYTATAGAASGRVTPSS